MPAKLTAFTVLGYIALFVVVVYFTGYAIVEFAVSAVVGALQ